MCRIEFLPTNVASTPLLRRNLGGGSMTLVTGATRLVKRRMRSRSYELQRAKPSILNGLFDVVVKMPRNESAFFDAGINTSCDVAAAVENAIVMAANPHMYRPAGKPPGSAIDCVRPQLRWPNRAILFGEISVHSGTMDSYRRTCATASPSRIG